jgi:2'-5' RNA ligase
MPRSAIVIHVPEASTVIGPWYSQPGASKNGIPPHITLLYPWRPFPVDDRDVATLESALARVAPFLLRFSAVGRFPGVLHLIPTPSERLNELIRRLGESFPDLPPYGGSFGLNPAPHLTVLSASESVLDDVELNVRAALEATPITAEVREVAVDAEVAPNRWIPIHHVSLSPDGRGNAYE